MSEHTTTEVEPMAYIDRKACGCFVWAAVDEPYHRADNAKEAAWAIGQGYTVDRVTCQYVRDNWRSDCAVCAPPVAQQEVLPL